MIKKLFAILLVLAVTLSFASTGIAQTALDEVPEELTEAEYRAQNAQIYSDLARAGFRVKINLADPKGVDPSLLPPDVADHIPPGVKIVAYVETERITVSEEQRASSACEPEQALAVDMPLMSVWCDDYDATIDVTLSSILGSVEQFSRVYAFRYDYYPPCVFTNCHGYEIEKQWAKWTRTSSSWTVTNGRIQSYIDGEDYCTDQVDATLNYASTFFDPTWDENETNWWHIIGFPDTAYVPFNWGESWTQSDISDGYLLRYDDERTSNWWPRD